MAFTPRACESAAMTGIDKAQLDAMVEAAHVYIARYSSSREQLRRVLARRADKLRRAGALEREAEKPLIEAALARIVGAGLIDDRAFALARARRLAREGRSRARIAEALAAKGVAREDASVALAALAEEQPAGDLAAAVTFARRRRLGPYRRAGADRARELAIFARGGFSLSLARRIVEAASIDALEAMLAEEA